MLTFIIPVRHQEGVKDWNGIKTRLEITLRSLQAQENPNWSAVIVANHGAEMPALPDRVELLRVDFPANTLPPGGEERYQAIRRDKGGRLAAGLVHAQPSGHVMVVDFDDLVSSRLAGLVAENPTANGWYFAEGYIFSGGAEVFLYQDAFHKICGTSHIVRADLLGIPARLADATELLVQRWLGSHIFIADDWRARGTPLAALPFTGAVYRVGHSNSTSGSEDLAKFIAQKNLGAVARQPGMMRVVDEALAAEFFGGLVA